MEITQNGFQQWCLPINNQYLSLNQEKNLINIGACYGSVNANTVPPNRQTVCDSAKQTAKAQKEKLSGDINKALENGVAITTDMWPDDYNRRAYTVLTCHYVDDEWKLNTRVLATAKFDARLPKTAENLKEQINRELQEFYFPTDFFSKIVFVSDQGANINQPFRITTGSHELLKSLVTHCHKDGQSGLRQTRKGTHRDRDDGDELSAMAALSVY
ncbi:UNVERIFIED_CONTAM: hypothetical protein FKN15_041974 [Acipenser sinensis]